MTQQRQQWVPIPIRVTFIRDLILTTVMGVGGSLVLRATHGFKPPSSSLGSFVKFELRRTQIMLSTQHMDLGTRFHDENSINNLTHAGSHRIIRCGLMMMRIRTLSFFYAKWSHIQKRAFELASRDPARVNNLSIGARLWKCYQERILPNFD